MTLQRFEQGEIGEIPPLTFDWRLRMSLEKAGMRQSDLADTLGLNRGTVSRWINGEKPRRAQVMACALALGVPFSWLDTGKAPADKPEPSDMARPEGFEPPTF